MTTMMNSQKAHELSTMTPEAQAVLLAMYARIPDRTEINNDDKDVE